MWPTSGITLCRPRVCHLYGTSVNSFGTHGLHCSKNNGLHFHHSADSEVSKVALASAKIAVHLDPAQS